MQTRAFNQIAFALLAVAALGSAALGVETARADSTATPPPSLTVVTIKDFAFKPAAVSVPVGATVEWVNQDSVAHTATSSGKVPAAFDSGNLDQGQKWSFTFKKAGTYTYVCSYHPNMTAKVIVAASSTSP